jgi:hypothetical protein
MPFNLPSAVSLVLIFAVVCTLVRASGAVGAARAQRLGEGDVSARPLLTRNCRSRHSGRAGLARIWRRSPVPAVGPRG